MEPQQCVEYALHIATAREDMNDIQRHLDATRQEIVDAQRAIEDLAIDACTLRVRMKELELDEELVKKSEDEAIMDKIMSQKRLVEIGGHESAVRALQKALDDARRELQATKDETQNVIAEEKKMQTELVSLSAILQRTRTSSVKYQEEYSSVMREKRESDVKLKQLCMFLQTDAPLSPASDAATSLSPGSAVSSSAASSPRASPRVVLQLGNDLEVAVPEKSFGFVLVVVFNLSSLNSPGATKNDIMDKYRRVEREKAAEDGVGAAPMEANEVRITQKGQVRSYISYANGLFTDKKETKVVLKAMGHAISKAVSVAEVLKHRVVGLHQITQISSIQTIDVYEPLEEGLDRVEQKRSIPGITIELSLEPLDTANPGYQPPIAEELVTAQVDEHDRPARRPKKPRAGLNTNKKAKDGQSKKPPMADAGVAVSQSDREEQHEAKQESAEDTKEAGSGGGKPPRGTRGGRGRGGGRGSGRGRGRGRGERGERNDDADRVQRDVAVVTGGISATAVSGNNADASAGDAVAAIATKKRAPRKKKTPFSGDADQQTKTAADRAAETTDDTTDGGDRENNGAGRGGRGVRGRGGGRGGGRSGGRGRGRSDGDGGRGDEVEVKATVAGAAAAAPVAPVSASS